MRDIFLIFRHACIRVLRRWSVSALKRSGVEALTSSDFTYEGVTGKMTWDKSGAATKVPVIVELGK